MSDTAGGAAASGTTVNGDTGAGGNHTPSPQPPVVAPDMMFKISKKIAQLTKVIYSLNTRNDDLELELEGLRANYEQRLAEAVAGLQASDGRGEADGAENVGAAGGGGARDTLNGDAEGEGDVPVRKPHRRRSKTPEDATAAAETKKELKRAKHIMKQLETKMKIMEEEHQKKATQLAASNPGGHIVLEKQLRQLTREKQDLVRHSDVMEVRNEQLKLENAQLKKDAEEAARASAQLQLQLSATRVQMKYNDEAGLCPADGGATVRTRTSNAPDDDFRDELLEKVEVLMAEKADALRQLQESRMVQQEQKRQWEAAKQQAQLDKFNAAAKERERSKNNAGNADEVLKVRKEKALIQTTLDEMRVKHKRDVEALKENIRKSHSEMDAARKLHETEIMVMKETCDRREEELKHIRAEAVKAGQMSERTTGDVRERLRRNEEEAAKARAELAGRQDSHERAAREAEQKLRRLEMEREESRKKFSDMETRLEIMKSGEKNNDDRIKTLEAALEEALLERQEILEAAAKEIDHHKSIAVEMEQKMMDDFEWKLREIESGNRAKVRELEAGARRAHDEYAHKKDAELTRLSIAARRDIEERKKGDIERLKGDLEARGKADKEATLAAFRSEKDMEVRVLQMSWDEEKNRLGRETRSLQRKLEDLPNEVAKAVRAARSEHDSAMQEQRKRAAKESERNQAELDKLRDEANGTMNRMRADYDERIRELESRLEGANNTRYNSMFQMKEEVETEFTERMEALRNMYRNEIEQLQEVSSKDGERAKHTEEGLREAIESQRKEVDELNSYYGKQEEDHEAKVNELLTRLAEQTSLAQRLQQELDECEWYEEDETAATAGGEGEVKKTGSRPPSAKPPHAAAAVAAAGDSEVRSTLMTNTVQQQQSGSAFLEPNPPPRTQRANTGSSSSSSQEQLESAATSSNSYTTADSSSTTSLSSCPPNSAPPPATTATGLSPPPAAEDHAVATSPKTQRSSKGFARLFQSPRLKKRGASTSSQGSSKNGEGGGGGNRKSQCTHQ